MRPMKSQYRPALYRTGTAIVTVTEQLDRHALPRACPPLANRSERRIRRFLRILPALGFTFTVSQAT
jgi:hypothetical protein